MLLIVFVTCKYVAMPRLQKVTVLHKIMLSQGTGNFYSTDFKQTLNEVFCGKRKNQGRGNLHMYDIIVAADST